MSWIVKGFVFCTQCPVGYSPLQAVLILEVRAGQVLETTVPL